MNVETLKDFRLTDEEWHTLMHCGEFNGDPAIVDVLVLAGLAFWEDEGSRSEGDWDLTDEGRAACDAIDLIFDWDEFVFVEASESPSDASDEPKQADALAEARASHSNRWRRAHHEAHDVRREPWWVLCGFC